MTNKKVKIEFEEGCFDNLEEEMTQEEMDELAAEIEKLVASGEFFDNAIPVDELPEEEQEEILNMLNGRKNRSEEHTSELQSH